jgi:hypothetical protein
MTNGILLQVEGNTTISGAFQFSNATSSAANARFVGDVLCTNLFTFANTPNHSVQVGGNFSCTGSLNMNGVGNYTLELAGGNNVINQGGFTTNATSKVVYLGSVTQNIAPISNYANLVVSGGGLKNIINDTKATNLQLDGAVVQMPPIRVLSVNTVTGLVPFEVNNMVRVDNTTFGGFLVKEGTSNAEFNGFIFPVGNNDGYFPVTISAINATYSGAGGLLAVKPITSTLGFSDYVPVIFEVASSNIDAVSNFMPLFDFAQIAPINTPNLVKLNGTNVPGSIVDLPNGRFGVNLLNVNTSINGTWLAMANPTPTYFRSIASGNWNDFNTWQGSADDITYFPLSAGQYPGYLNNGDIVSISGSTTVTGNVSPLALGSVTVSGMWNTAANNYTIIGQTLIPAAGSYITNNAATRTYFLDKVTINAGGKFL